MQLSGITDGDAVFLHRQSSFAKQHANGQPTSKYYMPSPSDRYQTSCLMVLVLFMPRMHITSAFHGFK